MRRYINPCKREYRREHRYAQHGRAFEHAQEAVLVSIEIFTRPSRTNAIAYKTQKEINCDVQLRPVNLPKARPIDKTAAPPTAIASKSIATVMGTASDNAGLSASATDRGRSGETVAGDT